LGRFVDPEGGDDSCTFWRHSLDKDLGCFENLRQQGGGSLGGTLKNLKELESVFWEEDVGWFGHLIATARHT
jgi:hypothetical protein